MSVIILDLLAIRLEISMYYKRGITEILRCVHLRRQQARNYKNLVFILYLVHGA